MTVWKVGSLSSVLASNKASKLLKRSDHFWSSSAIFESVVSLAGLLSLTDFAGLSECDLALDVVALSLSIFFILLASSPEPGDCDIPWPSTTPIIDTEAGSTREGLGECTLSLLGVESSDSSLLASHFSFLSLYEGVAS